MEESSAGNYFATILMHLLAAVFFFKWFSAYHYWHSIRTSSFHHIPTTILPFVPGQPPIISFYPFKQVSYDVCLAKCIGQVSFECETFSYCYDSQECMMSSEVVDTPPDDNQLVQQSDCVVIIRK